MQGKYMTSDSITDAVIKARMTFLQSDGFWDIYEDTDGITAEKGSIWTVPTEMAKKQSLEAKISFARVPMAYSLKRLKDVDPDYYKTNVTRELMIIQDYVSAFSKYLKSGQSLYIWSHMIGSGKTMTACAVANELVERGFEVLFMTSGTMFMKIRDTFNEKSKISTESLMDSFKKCELLILDDLGNEKMSAWTDETMFEVINARYLAHKPTLFTSNCNVTELNYNKRIIDRIKADCTIIHWPEEGVRNSIGDMNRQRQNEEWQQMELKGVTA